MFGHCRKRWHLRSVSVEVRDDRDQLDASGNAIEAGTGWGWARHYKCPYMGAVLMKLRLRSRRAVHQENRRSRLTCIGAAKKLFCV